MLAKRFAITCSHPWVFSSLGWFIYISKGISFTFVFWWQSTTVCLYSLNWSVRSSFQLSTSSDSQGAWTRYDAEESSNRCAAHLIYKATTLFLQDWLYLSMIEPTPTGMPGLIASWWYDDPRAYSIEPCFLFFSRNNDMWAEHSETITNI